MGAANLSVFVRRVARRGLDLDNSDTDGKEKERNPFCGGELFAQESDRKGSGSEDFHLVRDLERGHWEIANGNKLKRILDDIEDGGNRELPAVGTEYLATQEPKGRGPGIGKSDKDLPERLATPGIAGDLWDSAEGNHEGYGALEELIEKNGRGRRIGLCWGG